MKIKVCGLKENENVQEIISLGPDYLGFIFYKPSPRCVLNSTSIEKIKAIKGVNKVGVFVNENTSDVNNIVTEFNLSHVQLHGNESISYIEQLSKSIKVIKAIKVKEETDILKAKEFENYCDYILFDTYTTHEGGSGIKFDWSWLKNYNAKIPFLLAGGINENDTIKLNELKKENEKFAGVDLNSKFEINPGIKDIQKLKTFIICIK